MKKVVFTVVDSCSKVDGEKDGWHSCPFHDWDSPHDSGNGGIFCEFNGDYREVIDYYAHNNRCKNHDGPVLGRDYPPEWCPLQSVDSETIKKINELLEAKNNDQRSGDNSDGDLSKESE